MCGACRVWSVSFQDVLRKGVHSHCEARKGHTFSHACEVGFAEADATCQVRGAWCQFRNTICAAPVAVSRHCLHQKASERSTCQTLVTSCSQAGGQNEFSMLPTAASSDVHPSQTNVRQPKQRGTSMWSDVATAAECPSLLPPGSVDCSETGLPQQKSAQPCRALHHAASGTYSAAALSRRAVSAPNLKRSMVAAAAEGTTRRRRATRGTRAAASRAPQRPRARI
jgi:hypothetical protein